MRLLKGLEFMFTLVKILIIITISIMKFYYFHSQIEPIKEKRQIYIKQKFSGLYTQFLQSKPKFSHMNFPLENTEINPT